MIKTTICETELVKYLQIFNLIAKTPATFEFSYAWIGAERNLKIATRSDIIRRDLFHTWTNYCRIPEATTDL